MIVISGLEPKKYRITQDGIKELEQQLQELKDERPEIAEEISEMSSQSTVSATNALEESGLALERNRAQEVQDQIALLERIIAMAEVVAGPDGNKTVQIGSQVTVMIDGHKQELRLVGPIEADPSDGKVSDESPLGQSMLGKAVGDKVTIASPSGQVIEATIKSIV